MADVIRAEDIAAAMRLLEREYRPRQHILSVAEVGRWMAADDRFASYVEEHQPDLADRVADHWRRESNG